MKKQIKIGDKVSFKLGWGTVIDKYRDATGYYWKYDIQLDIGYQVLEANGWVDDVNQRGKIYSTRFVNVD